MWIRCKRGNSGYGIGRFVEASISSSFCSTTLEYVGVGWSVGLQSPLAFMALPPEKKAATYGNGARIGMIVNTTSEVAMLRIRKARIAAPTGCTVAGLGATPPSARALPVATSAPRTSGGTFLGFA